MCLFRIFIAHPLCLCFLAAPPSAQAAPAFVSPQRLLLREVRKAALTAADSRDGAWRAAAKLPALSLALGDGSKELLPLQTQVLAQWDERFLYLRFVCEAGEIYAPFFRRDAPIYQGDGAEVFLDAVGDGRQVVEVQLAPGGGIFDQQILLTSEAKFDENLVLLPEILERDYWLDTGWNLAEMKTATSRTPNGWIADFALPTRAILRRRGLKTFAPMTLRANFLRYDWAPDNTSAWGLKDASGQKRRLNAHNWAPIKHGSPHISRASMGFLRLVP